MIGKLEGSDFDKWLSQSEVAAREERMRADDAFTTAMKAAISRGKEKATVGTFVDTSPAVGARRVIATVPISACGSPAAMCMQAAVSENGTTAMLK